MGRGNRLRVKVRNEDNVEADKFGGVTPCVGVVTAAVADMATTGQVSRELCNAAGFSLGVCWVCHYHYRCRHLQRLRSPLAWPYIHSWLRVSLNRPL